MEDIFHLGVKALIKNHRGKILVLEKNPKHSSGLNPPHWDLPGGRIKRSNDLEKTLKREVEEEIGIKDLKIIEFLDASISKVKLPHGKDIVGLTLFTYLCTVNNPEDIKLTDDEHVQFKWVSPNEAAKLLKIKFSDSFIRKLKDL